MPPINIEQALQRAVQFQMTGRVPEAQELCRQVLAQVPNHPAALHLLGAMASLTGEHAQAVKLLRQVVALQPNNPGGHASLGLALANSQQLDEAIDCYNRAIALNPSYARAHCNLGVALASKARMKDAIASFERALKLNPNYPEALCNLGNALTESGALDAAVNSLQRAIALRPNYAEAHLNLGTALAAGKKFEQAIASYQRALQLKPDDPKTLANLANALLQTGQLDQAIATYRRTLEVKPDDAQSHSGLIFAMHYHAGCDAGAIRQELQNWNRQHARPLATGIRPHDNDRTADRRLRIGYVSPDLCRHSVARFLLPVLRAHEREQYEIFCYASVVRPDDMTARLREHADVWRDVAGISDERLAEQIRQDRIDVLVDLALHTGRNRLLAFARKPAPVQVTYLAYCGSSGMDAMDYRLTDSHFDPPGIDESAYSEQSVRLPETYWCYEPTGDEPEVNPLPASVSRHITFGCLNSFAKVTPPTLDAWVRLMRQVQDSRLILHAPAGAGAQRVRAFFAQAGIDAIRLELLDTLPSRDYFKAYQRIDIALDPFPFGGGTTSCDALWTGVPLVSWAASATLSRGGLSILSNIGLPQLVGSSVEQYVQIAVDLARDRQRLAELRQTLRDRMRRSPLMDATSFARNLETAYRAMWRQWCSAR